MKNRLQNCNQNNCYLKCQIKSCNLDYTVHIRKTTYLTVLKCYGFLLMVGSTKYKCTPPIANPVIDMIVAYILGR
jgi:hypothetical protein